MDYRLKPINQHIVNRFERASVDEPCYFKRMLNIKLQPLYQYYLPER